MKTLSATLEAAQKRASGQPYVKARLADYTGLAQRLRLTRHYTGAEAESSGIAVTGADDGSLIRARITAGELFVSRVTTPTSGSTFSSWTSLGAVQTGGKVALMSKDGSAGVLMAYVHTDDVSVRIRLSSDYGATWGAAQTIATAGAAVNYIAGAYAGNDIALVWGEGAAGAIFRARFTSGVGWGARTAWGVSGVAGVNGLAVYYSGIDWQVVVCGTETTTSKLKLWTIILGNGGDLTADTWSSLITILEGHSSSQIYYTYPSIGVLGGFRCFFIEGFAGTVAYSRLHSMFMDSTIYTNFVQEGWSEPIGEPFEGAGAVAMSTFNLGGTLWFVSSAGVWSTTPGSELDLDAAVVEAAVELDDRGGRAVLELNNAAGTYTAYGSGSLAVLRRGSRLQLTPGYKTTAGNETPAAYSYWVESIELVTGPRPRLVLRARDAWSLLESWRARRQHAWAAGDKSISQLLTFVLAKAGLAMTGGTSTALSAQEPAFTIHAGESGATAVRRLLAMVSEVAWFDGATLTLRNPAEGDSSQYTLGAGHAVIASGRYQDLGPPANRASVVGLADVRAEAFDFDDVAGVERVATVVDINLTTTHVNERATTLLRDAERASRLDLVELFGVNCGQELHDVVTLTDAAAGLSAVKRRVREVRWSYRTGAKFLYFMTLGLGPA